MKKKIKQFFPCCDIEPKVDTECTRRRDEAINNPSSNDFIPNCESNGDFKDVQCRGMSCFCVDRNGNEIQGTKTSRPSRPNCDGETFHANYNCFEF